MNDNPVKPYMSWHNGALGSPVLYAQLTGGEPVEKNRNILCVVFLFDMGGDTRLIAFEGVGGLFRVLGENGFRKWVVGGPAPDARVGYHTGLPELSKGRPLREAVGIAERFAGRWFEAGCELAKTSTEGL